MLRKERILRQSGLTVFNRGTIANLLGVGYASTNPILYRLVCAGVLTRLKRDRYVLTERATEETRKVANELVKPSAISLWTALSDAGITTQVPHVIQSVTPKRSADITRIGSPSFKYFHLPRDLYFGAMPDDAGIFRMPPEKALLDLLTVQRGSLDWDSINLRELDRAMLRRLTRRFPAWVRRAIAASPLKDISPPPG